MITQYVASYSKQPQPRFGVRGHIIDPAPCRQEHIRSGIYGIVTRQATQEVGQYIRLMLPIQGPESACFVQRDHHPIPKTHACPVGRNSLNKLCLILSTSGELFL
jgi:hypothetical protein